MVPANLQLLPSSIAPAGPGPTMEQWLRMRGRNGPGVPAARARAVAEAISAAGFDDPEELAEIDEADAVALMNELADGAVTLGDRAKLKKWFAQRDIDPDEAEPPRQARGRRGSAAASRSPSPSPPRREYASYDTSGNAGSRSSCSWTLLVALGLLFVFAKWVWNTAEMCGCQDNETSIVYGAMNLERNCKERAFACYTACTVLGRSVRSNFYEFCLRGRQ